MSFSTYFSVLFCTAIGAFQVECIEQGVSSTAERHARI